MKTYRLLTASQDAPGLVAAFGHFIADFGGNIVEAHHHLDINSKIFFMRNEVEAKTLACSFAEFKQALADFAEKHQTDWRLFDSGRLKRIVLLGSKTTHCIADLLHRDHEKELEGRVVGVVSNHQKLAKIADWYRIPFYHTPPPKDEKSTENFARTLQNLKPDVIVLARYMQIIPKFLCTQYAGKMINIHHSFLPSFAGADPYQQALRHGVKIIGATCHYVTEKLDGGPIIEQGVVRVDHTHDVGQMQKMGRDVEKITLAKGLQYHLEDRIMICRNRTIIFS